LNPAFRSNFRDALDRFEGVRMVYDEAVQKYRNDLVHDDDGELVIQLGKLRLLPHGSALLYEFLSPLAIPAKMIRQIIDAGTRPAGRQFFTPTHRLVIDRDVLIVQPYREDDPVEFIISGPQGIIEEPLWLKWETIPRGTTKLPLKESATAHLDAALVEFPMVLRRWKEGDRFQPYGMTGQKKLSDFFTDLKLSLPEKESVWILTSRDQIIWVVGHRIDHRYRITRTTKKILRIETKELRN
jgi:tRNA(Ile)-lysidine synthase